MNEELKFSSTLLSLQTSRRADSPAACGLITYINGASSPVYIGELGGIKQTVVTNLLAKKNFKFVTVLNLEGARGSVVVKALCYKLAGRGSIPDGVIGIFH